jgi:3-oxoacyl-[acyl-carrier protein] reductase
METKYRVAIITGAARGIGRAIAMTFAEKRIIPVIADIDNYGAQLVVGQIEQKGIVTVSYQVDVSNVEQIAQMVDDVVKKFGHIDILVNNAGILSKASIEELKESEWDRVMNINAKSAMFASQQVLKYMRKQGWGRIINISSMAGRMGGFSTGCAYSASKAAVLGMTMCIARKVAAYNITVNAIAPGPTESDLFMDFTAAERFDLEKSILVGRMGKPENIAETVVFLASDAASYITGAVIDVNGGMFMG